MEGVLMSIHRSDSNIQIEGPSVNHANWFANRSEAFVHKSLTGYRRLRQGVSEIIMIVILIQ